MLEASAILARYQTSTQNFAQKPIAKSQAINGKHMSKKNYALIPPDLKIGG